MTPLPMDWDAMHRLSREQVCVDAAVNVSVAACKWSEIEEWLRMLLTDGLERRSYGRLTFAA